MSQVSCLKIKLLTKHILVNRFMSNVLIFPTYMGLIGCSSNHVGRKPKIYQPVYFIMYTQGGFFNKRKVMSMFCVLSCEKQFQQTKIKDFKPHKHSAVVLKRGGGRNKINIGRPESKENNILKLFPIIVLECPCLF